MSRSIITLALPPRQRLLWKMRALEERYIKI